MKTACLVLTSIKSVQIYAGCVCGSNCWKMLIMLLVVKFRWTALPLQNNDINIKTDDHSSTVLHWMNLKKLLFGWGRVRLTGLCGSNIKTMKAGRKAQRKFCEWSEGKNSELSFIQKDTSTVRVICYCYYRKHWSFEEKHRNKDEVKNWKKALQQRKKKLQEKRMIKFAIPLNGCFKISGGTG